MLIAEARAPRRSLPRVLYILGLAAMVAIALRPRSLFLYVAIWTAQHWILAMGLASQTPGGEPAPASGTVRRVFHALNVRPWAILLVLGAASVLLLPLFEVEASLDGGTFYGDRIFGAAAEATAYFFLGSRIGSHRIRDRLRALPPGPQRIPDVGSPRACRGARPARPVAHLINRKMLSYSPAAGPPVDDHGNREPATNHPVIPPIAK